MRHRPARIRRCGDNPAQLANRRPSLIIIHLATLNAALRAAARVGRAVGYEMLGVEDGYVGLMDGRFRPLDLRALDEAARRGGTILGSARSKIFPTPEGQTRAREMLATHRVRGLLVIGGNGSLTGARTMVDAVRVAGIPASIDNDLACTELTRIGYGGWFGCQLCRGKSSREVRCDDDSIQNFLGSFQIAFQQQGRHERPGEQQRHLPGQRRRRGAALHQRR